MSFLQPAMLLAIPVIALPIIIHLINQRRFQTVQWAAMLFLLAANRMSRGYARLRQWLILAARTIAIAGLGLCHQPTADQWLAGTRGGQPRRHHHHLAGPIGQHERARHRWPFQTAIRGSTNWCGRWGCCLRIVTC